MTPLVLITDPGAGLERTSAIVRAAARGVGAARLLVQLRDKSDARRRTESAHVLRRVTSEVGALLVINGDVTLALAVSADGAHVPSHDVVTARAALGARAFVTTPAHDDDDVRHAASSGASAVLVSPIFATPGKGAPRGVDALRRARAIVQSSGVLLYALGGVDTECVNACAAAGADGVAVIRALYDAADPEAIAHRLAAAWRAPPVAPNPSEC